MLEKMNDTLIETFARDYLQPLYYFCLRKTCSAEEGEELAADIGLQVITALRRGTVPVQFSAWVWRIARNRYAAWCDARARYRERMTVSALDEALSDATAATPEDAVIAAEEVQLLRRELAFIGREWRELIVAYYFEHRTLRSIAASLAIPEGTAKTRLFQSRKRLLEGMQMSREFGRRSFDPEKINFSSSGSFETLNPWDHVDRALPKNILLEASNNPSTLEQLAIELGVALPYMEDEVDRLVGATLLKQIVDKYVTNFPIIDVQTQTAVRAKQLENAKARAALFARILRELEPQLLALGLYRDGIPLEVQRRLWAVRLIDDVIIKDAFDDEKVKQSRPAPRTWNFTGYEETDLPNMHSSLNGGATERYRICAYIFSQLGQRYAGARDFKQINTADVIGDILAHQRAFSSLSTPERELIQASPYLHIEGDTVVADIAIMTQAQQKALRDIFRAHPAAAAFLEMMSACYRATAEIFHTDSYTHIREQIYTAIGSTHFELRAITMLDLIDIGYLEAPEDPAHDLSMIYLVIED